MRKPLSLQQAEEKDGELIYRGRVGTGFDDALLEKMRSKLEKLIIEEKPVSAEAHEEKKSIWTKPKIVGEVEYSMVTNNGTFRDPVYKRLMN